MNFSELIKNRRSIRRYSGRKVSDKIVYQALEAGLWVPSAGNVQDKEFIIVRDKNKKLELVEAVFEQVWVAKAPVIIILLSNINKLKFKFKERAEFYATLSAGAAIQNILLSLTSNGLQGTHVGLFDEIAVKRVLNIPDDRKVFSIITLGYPAEKPPVPYRIELKQATFFDEFGNKWVKHKVRETHLE